MKKSILSMAALALMMTSCSHNELYDNDGGPITNQDPNVISFQSVVGLTRAITNDATLNTLQDAANGFNVVALKNGGTALFTNKRPDDGKADDKQIAYAFNKGDNAWKWLTLDEDKKWPTDPTAYPLTFFASYPSYDVNKHVLDNNGRVDREFSIDETMSAQIDWLAALAVENSRPANGITALVFKHILSNICFQVATPQGYKVYVQSVKVVNVAKAGRTYNFQTGTWSAEPGSPYATLSSYTYFASSNIGEVKEIVGTGGGIELAGTDGNTLKLLPQGASATAVPAWDNSDQGFGKGAKAWSSWTDNNPSSATKLDGWYTKDYKGLQLEANVESGMNVNGSAETKAFWAGARIEVVYRMENASGKSIIGRKSKEKYEYPANSSTMLEAPEGGLFVRVGFPLKLWATDNGNGLGKGWLPGYKYTYTLNLGTPTATNGTLLDPNYKKVDGTDDKTWPVDNPNINPGDPITKDGYITFDVTVDKWKTTAVEIL